MDRSPPAQRIIVTGSSGVGKTTLVEALALDFGLPVIPELARMMCAASGYARIGEIPDQERFKRDVLNAQIERESELDSFISDRSSIDCWVLWQRWNICSAMTFDTESYYRLARKQAEQYTHIVYVPPMFPPVEDGFRWTDLDYQGQIDRMVRSTLYDFELLDRTFVVSGSDTESRRQEVATWLRSPG